MGNIALAVNYAGKRGNPAARDYVAAHHVARFRNNKGSAFFIFLVVNRLRITGHCLVQW